LGGDKIEARLTAADQLEINRGKQPPIDQRAVLLAVAQIDGEAPAQRVEIRRLPGKALACEQQRVDDPRLQRHEPRSSQFGIDEGEIELGIVDDERVLADEIEEVLRDLGKE